MMRCMGWIPARSGSTRVPHKNTRDFCGRPLVEWSILQALHSGVFDDIVVSTDDPEVMSVATKYQQVTLLERSAEASRREAHITMAVDDTLDRLGNWDVWYILPPPNPLRLPSDVARFTTDFDPSSWDAAVGATPEPLWYWSGTVEDGVFRLKFPEAPTGDTQDRPLMHVVDLGVWLISGAAIANKSAGSLWCRFSENMKAIRRPSKYHGDIDVEEQWEDVEAKMQQHILPHWHPEA